MAGTPKLIVLSEKLRGKTFELTKDVQSAGRTEDKDICIKDPTISSHHCDFVKTEKSYILRDNQSTNGTRVNNVPITEQELKNSDILQLGGVEILYDCDDDTATSVTRTQTGIDLDSTEIGIATVATQHNLVYSLSTMGTTSAQELGDAVSQSRRWFQLYVWRDREQTRSFVAQAKDAGFEALILTVDTPVAGQRNRDIRNGLTVPPKINSKTFFNMATKMKWWFNVLTTPALEFATFRQFTRPLSEIAATFFDASVTFEDLAWLKSIWGGPIIVKGIQSVADAKMLAKMGVDAIVLSNHGGRQLDCGVVPLELLPEVVAAVGKKMEIYIDGGVMSGKDILAAIGFGADAVLIGRAYLYGAMAGGMAGVEKCIEILAQEMKTTMQLTGVTSIAEFTSEYVNLRQN